MPTGDGVVFGSLSKVQKDKVLDRVAKLSADRFKSYVRTLKQSMDFKRPAPEERLAYYRTRLPQVWAVLQSQAPQLYSQQLREWVNMERRAAQRQLSPWNPFNPKSGAPAHTPPNQQ